MIFNRNYRIYRKVKGGIKPSKLAVQYGISRQRIYAIVKRQEQIYGNLPVLFKKLLGI